MSKSVDAATGAEWLVVRADTQPAQLVSAGHTTRAEAESEAERRSRTEPLAQYETLTAAEVARTAARVIGVKA